MSYGLGRGRTSCAALAVSVALAPAAVPTTAFAATGPAATATAVAPGGDGRRGSAVHGPAAPALTVDEIVAQQRRGARRARRGSTRSARCGSTGTVVFGGGDFRDRGGAGRSLATRPGPDAQRGEPAGPDGGRRLGRQGGVERRSPSRAGATRRRRRPTRRRTLAREADIDGPLVDWREKGHRVEYLGTEDVDGTPAHKLRVTLKDGDTQYVFLDPDYLLEIRVRDRVAASAGSSAITETDLGDYEQVAGVWFPMSMRVGAEGRARGTRASRSNAPRRTSRPTTAVFRIPPAGPAMVARDRRRARARRAPSAAPPAPRSAAAGRAPSSTPASLSGLGARNIGSATMSGRISARGGAQRGRQDDRLRRRGERRRLEVARRRHDVQAGLRQAARAVDRRDRHRPVQPDDGLGRHGRDAGRATPSRSATASTSRPTAATTWTNVGLPESERIVRDRRRTRRTATSSTPACPGKLWSDSAERGVYKTTDGGKTWTLVAQGREPLDRLLRPRDGPEEPGASSSPACGTSGARAGRSARAATGPTRRAAAGSSAPHDGGKTWTTLDGRRRTGPAREAVGPRRGRGRAVGPAASSTRSSSRRDSRALPLGRRRQDLGGARPAAR